MAKFVIYEVWTCHRVVEAESEEAAYDLGPDLASRAKDNQELNLANWHVVPVADETPGGR